MGMLLPAISLALVHIAGDNVGVVPDAVAALGADIYIVTLLAYVVLGSLMTGISAWIGARSGYELGFLVKRMFGCRGKKVMALATLAISIPASALTGGYFAGWLVHDLTGLPYVFVVPLCLLVFSLFALGYWPEILALSNYLSLLLVPVIVLLVTSSTNSLPQFPSVEWGSINWLLILALLGYNAGGIRPPLVTEAAAYLAKRGFKAVCLAVSAKIVEGIFTLAMAHLVLVVGTQGPLALAQAVAKLLGANGAILFSLILLCVFINTMAPAMMANARQIATITGLSLGPALITAAAIVYLVTFLDCGVILKLMSFTGVMTAVFVAYTAYVLHKYGINQ